MNPNNTPTGGWDNAADMPRAKEAVRNLGVAIHDLDPKRGLPVLEALARQLYDMGISESFGVDLILDLTNPAVKEVALREAVEDFYNSQTVEAGLLSLARPVDSPWNEADEADDSWLEGAKSAWPFAVDYEPKSNGAKLADTFLEARPRKLISTQGKGGALYTRTGPIWRELSEAELAFEIRRTDPLLKLSPSQIESIIKAVHQDRFTDATPYQWIDPPDNAPAPDNLILFGNGMLDFDSRELLPHTEAYFATGLPSFGYDADADCPLWRAKLAEWLDESFHDTLQEFMGYLLTPDTRIEKFLALIGATRGGKGTILHIVRELVGADHYASRTMSAIAGDFGLEGTTDKRVLVIPDAHNAPSQKRGAVLETLKSVSGNDVVSVNRKNKTILDVRIPAKVILVANEHPKLLDESGALAAREVPIIFERSFLGREDDNLRAKLEAELPGIANWALEGLERLRFNGGRFSIGDKGKAASQELAYQQSPALRFARDCLTVTRNPADVVKLNAMFERYQVWAEHSEGLSRNEVRNRTDFRANLEAALRSQGVEYAQHRWHNPDRPNGKGKPVRGFWGVRLRGFR